MGGLGLGARAATAGRRLRGRRGGSAAGGGTWPRGWLLKLVPFFLRTWTLLRLSRGNSDSLSAYLRPPHPPPRPSSLPPTPRPFQVWKHLWTRRRALLPPTWAESAALGGSPAAGEGTGAQRSKRELSSPACLVPCGPPAGWRAQGAEDPERVRQRGAAGGRPPSAPSSLPLTPAPLFSNSGACVRPLFQK